MHIETHLLQILHGPDGCIPQFVGRKTFCERARLVQDDGPDLVGGLKAFRIFDENAVGGTVPHGGDDGCGRSKAQRARAGDHQYGYHVQKAQREAVRTAPDAPAKQCHQRNPDNHRDEHGGNPVHQLLDGRLGSLGIPYHPDNGRQDGVFSRFLGLYIQDAAFVQGSGINAVAFLLQHGSGLAGQHAFVHDGAAVQDDAVGRNPFSGAYGKHFAGTDCPDRLQVHEAADGGGGAMLRPLFQQPSHQDKSHNHGGRFEIQMRLQPTAGPHLREQQIEYAEKVGNAHRKGYQRIHIGTAVPQGAEPRFEKTPAAPHHNRRSEGPEDISFEREVLESHADNHHQSSQCDGDNGIGPEFLEGCRAGSLGF